MDKERIHTLTLKSDAADLAELAAAQGVSPVTDFDSLLGHPSSEDESIDEFAALLREWRREGPSPAPDQ